MKKLTSFQLFHNPKSDTLDVILHGGSYDIDTPFMQKVFKTCKDKGHSVIAFNFPYIERGEERSSKPELKEELEILQKFLDYCDYKNFRKVRFVGKSLGAIVASFYLDKLSTDEAERFSIIILGYVTSSLRLKDFKGQITIIQGEKDKFGNVETVKKDLNGTISQNIQYFEIKGANHSFCDSETKEPMFEDEVMKALSKLY